MSRSKELVKNTAILTVGKLCTQFISFLLLPLYTALLSTEEYGIVDLFTTYVALLLPLVCWQLDQGLFRFMLDCRDEKNKVIELFSSMFFLNVIQCTVTIVFYLLFSSFLKSEYSIYLLINVIFNVFSGILMQFARGLGKMGNYSISSFITAATTVALNVLFVAVLKWGAHGMFIATVCGVAINCVYLFVVLKVWKFIDVKKINVKLLKEVCKYSLPFVPNQISGWVLSASNRTVITNFISVSANGIFSVASKFSSMIGTFYNFFNMAWVETVSVHYEDEDRDSFLSDMMNIVINLFVSLCVGVIAFMPFIFPFMVDEAFNEAYFQIPILILAVIFQILVGLYSAIYIALKKSIMITRTTLAGAIINIVVSLVLIKFIGLYAASVATLISYMATALFRAYDTKKYVNIKLNKSSVLVNVLVVIVICITYYINNETLNVAMLVVVIVYAIFINKNLIKIMVEEIKKLTNKARG